MFVFPSDSFEHELSKSRFSCIPCKQKWVSSHLLIMTAEGEGEEELDLVPQIFPNITSRNLYAATGLITVVYLTYVIFAELSRNRGHQQ